MADKIKVPVFGETNKTAVYVIGGVSVIVVGYAVYRIRQNNASVSADTSTADTVDTSSEIDPATGYIYGSAEDAAALAAQAGYVSPADYGSGSTSVAGGGGTATLTQTQVTSNPQWSQAAEDYLANTVGLSATEVQAALGKYLTGGQVDTSQKSIIQQAIAAEGLPPQSGPNGYPPSIRDAVAAPSKPAKTPLGTTHVTVASRGTKSAKITWSKVPHAQTYYVHREGHAAQKTTGTAMTVPRPGTYYVTAGATGYYSSNASNLVTV